MKTNKKKGKTKKYVATNIYLNYFTQSSGDKHEQRIE